VRDQKATERRADEDREPDRQLTAGRKLHLIVRLHHPARQRPGGRRVDRVDHPEDHGDRDQQRQRQPPHRRDHGGQGQDDDAAQVRQDHHPATVDAVREGTAEQQHERPRQGADAHDEAGTGRGRDLRGAPGQADVPGHVADL